MVIESPQPPHKQWLPTATSRRFLTTTEAATYFSELFVTHGLESLAQRSALNLNTRSRWFQGCALFVLDYGVPVRITPEGLSDFFLIQIPLAGSVHMRVGDKEVLSTPQRASLPPTDQPAVITWHQESPHLMVYLPRDIVEETARKLYGVSSAAGLTLAHFLDLETPRGQRFMIALKEFHDDLEAIPLGGLTSVTTVSLESMIMRLLLAIDHSLSRSLPSLAKPATKQPPRDSLAHRFIELLRKHSTEDIQISDLAERLGVSVRTLQTATAEAFQRTPLQLIRAERLRVARELLHDPAMAELSISDIALQCGFNHFGRFAAEYKKRFGESPRTARAKHKLNDGVTKEP